MGLLEFQYNLFPVVCYVDQARYETICSQFLTRKDYQPLTWRLNEYPSTARPFAAYLVLSFSIFIGVHISVWSSCISTLLVHSHLLRRRNFRHPSSYQNVSELQISDAEARKRLHCYAEFNNLINELWMKYTFVSIYLRKILSNIF